jgi:hypothetical protein
MVDLWLFINVNAPVRGIGSATVQHRSKFPMGSVNRQNDGRASERTKSPHAPRRLSDKILIAFHHACDQGDHVTAKALLDTLEFMMTRQTVPSSRRKITEGLVAAHERLWSIRHERPAPQ